jgi:hypothetical protein
MTPKAGDDVGKPYRKQLINSNPYYEKLLRNENRIFLAVVLYLLGNLMYGLFF